MGNGRRKVLTRWLLVLCAGLLFWGGWRLWPSIATRRLPVLVLPRDPYLAGFKVGTSQKEAVRELVREYYQKGLAAHGGPGRIAVKRAVGRARAAASRAVKEEIRGLADATGLPERLLWAANIAVDLYSGSSLMACSVVVAPRQDGGFLVGRNLDFFDFGVLHKHTVLLVRPRGRAGWTASLGWPGLVGILTGWNDRGEFCSLNLGFDDSGRCTDVKALPALFMIRRVLESQAPPSRKIAWLRKQPPSFPMILCFADSKGGAIIEKSASGGKVRRLKTGAAYAANHMLGWGGSMGARCRTLQGLAAQHAVTREALEETLRKVTLGSSLSQSFCTLYSVVFNPKTGEAWVADGLLPATRGPYRKIVMPERMERDESRYPAGRRGTIHHPRVP
jgi:hypothetical protein